ncbi:aminopeptidase P family protein [Carboxylicivirga mesophila]|uniref:Aminopeptidase P family protein n=1 Tax=Carboxylicivirga mesophila TaxID=1166478 RepID=A0ABS5KDZ5_9BACT|nr:aminopeptidase P family protein [Carboxylicivirga mesophila]MBS2213220.1 aminopeptidase P family protein [Carboxylicivirga mesophila]
MSTPDRLFKLRNHMATLGVDACIITSADPHLSEYPSSHWKFREWLSGFTGSAGTVVVTNEEAGLWTDSRYFLQAEQQLEDSGMELYRMGTEGVPDYKDWLTENLNAGAVVGVNGKTMTVNELRSLAKLLKKADIRLDAKLFMEDDIWEARPLMPEDGIFELGTEYTGLSRTEKIAEVRRRMKAQGATHYIITTLDEVAWLLNFRGQDVQYNPVFHAYLVVSHNHVNLFIDPHKLTSSIGKQLSEEDIKIFIYNDFYNFIKDMPPLAKVIVDPNRTNSTVYSSLPQQSTKIETTSIVTNLKAQKNEVEIENFRKAMVKDGVAMTKFLCWLDNTIGKETITEYSAAARLSAFRAEQPNYHGDSFNTISGYAGNGAIVHYAVQEESAAELQPKGLFLIDSGGQYLEGTTDITRTVALGPLTDEEKTDFTLVLKGNIGLDMAVFPTGTRGVHLDILARQAMWQQGINYGHGTGHGIGHFLCVHEGPQSIRPQDNGVEIKDGMISSNEPGIYKSGKHGIRIENLILTLKDRDTDFGSFLKFETLTLCPVDKRAINTELLTVQEKTWLNNYHQKVYDLISPLLYGEEKEWLKNSTKPL